MKNISIAYVILLLIGCTSSENKIDDSSHREDSFYESVQLGDYGIGFCDTVIYNSDIRFDFLHDSTTSYTQYDYIGPTPLFLQIWHPVKPNNLEPMMLKDFRNRDLSPELQSVYDPLIEKMDSFFVKYNIVEDFINYDSIDYGNYSYFDVLDTLMTFKTMSSYQIISDKLDFPVVVYHHGGQGLSDENFLMAEYFASKGYIVVSSNFHLPFENKTYGYEGVDFDDTELPKSVIQFAKTLTTNDQLYFIGHSSGAQVGFKFLHESHGVDAFISLETTLEGRDPAYLKSEDGWPKLAKIIDEHKLDYVIPILMIANTQEEKSFPLFDELQNAQMIQISQKEMFGHESYTAGYLLRYLYRNKFTQPDTAELKTQLSLYSKQLLLYESFLTSAGSGKQMNTEEFKHDFFISIPSTNANNK
ncbi:hypothetical protein [Ekhidna sp.]|uniref:alpha/beta hydrolase family protein n=1 Tax=Ekhidna sp. TaxID=2608089 RepID=UPI00329A4E72